jgi:hypothetical protein
MLGLVALLLVGRVESASAQHEGHPMTQHEGHAMPTDSTPRMRTAAAEQRTWLGIQIGFFVGALVLYLAWWIYQTVKERRARLAKTEGRAATQPAEQSRPLPRQRRRH